MNEKLPIIFFEPIIKETVWGGERLKEFGYTVPSAHCGEAWIFSAHKSGDCKTSFHGLTLSELWKNHREVFGNLAGETFPIMIKIIDAQTDSSIQVHPTDAYAKLHENGERGKTECWFILDCKKNARIIIGHNAKTKAELQTMIAEKKWSSLLREKPIHAGDFFFIEAGTVHAIKGGTLLLEVQEASDITYRVYDYDRITNGKLRPLHLEKSLDVIEVPFVEKKCATKQNDVTIHRNIKLLASCNYFSVGKLSIHGNETLSQSKQFLLCSVIAGAGFVDGFAIRKGANFMLPYLYGSAQFSGDMEIVFSWV